MNYGDENGQMHNEEVAAPVGEGVSKKKRKKKALRKQVLEEAINADSAAGKIRAGLPLSLDFFIWSHSFLLETRD